MDLKQHAVEAIPKGWRLVDISQFCSLQRGFDITEAQRLPGAVPVYSSSGLAYFHNKALVEPPGVVTGRKGLLGKVFLIKEPFWPHDTTLWVKDFKGNDPAYVALVLEAFRLEKLDAATSVPTLNRNSLAGHIVSVPSTRAEQETISGALSDADALIASLEQLIAKKRQIKQGAMQELLTGSRRLAGFNEAWRDLCVDDMISKHFCGPSPTCEERNIEGNEWGVLKTTAITWEAGWDWTKHKVLPRVFWDQPDVEVRSGDVVVTKAGPRHRVAVSAWVDQVPARILVSGKMIGLRPQPDRAHPLMLAAAIASRETQRYLDQRTTGMAESQVNFENAALLSAPIRLPDMKEQLAISRVVDDIGAEGRALEAKLSKVRQIKQAMMQELLTGRIRLV